MLTSIFGTLNATGFVVRGTGCRRETSRNPMDRIGVALRNDVDQATLTGILIVVQVYAGMPRANSAARLALEVLNQRGAA
jgi:hypothetical protein